MILPCHPPFFLYHDKASKRELNLHSPLDNVFVFFVILVYPTRNTAFRMLLQINPSNQSDLKVPLHRSGPRWPSDMVLSRSDSASLRGRELQDNRIVTPVLCLSTRFLSLFPTEKSEICNPSGPASVCYQASNAAAAWKPDVPCLTAVFVLSAETCVRPITC